MRVVPYPGVMKLGQVGNAPRAIKRALSKAGIIRWQPFTLLWGPFSKIALQNFQRKHGIQPTGLYGKPTHAKLAPSFDDYGVWLLAQKPVPKTDARRTRIVAACTLTYNHRGEIDYTQGSRRMEGVLQGLKPPRFPRMMDCSSGATWLYYAADAPDPNGRGYDGFGYTGTLATHGRLVTVSQAKPGDLILYGPAPNFSHVTVYLGWNGREHRCWSHGSSAGPLILNIDYRSDRRQIRAYLP